MEFYTSKSQIKNFRSRKDHVSIFRAMQVLLFSNENKLFELESPKFNYISIFGHSFYQFRKPARYDVFRMKFARRKKRLLEIRKYENSELLANKQYFWMLNLINIEKRCGPSVEPAGTSDEIRYWRKSFLPIFTTLILFAQMHVAIRLSWIQFQSKPFYGREYDD